MIAIWVGPTQPRESFHGYVDHVTTALAAPLGAAAGPSERAGEPWQVRDYHSPLHADEAPTGQPVTPAIAML